MTAHELARENDTGVIATPDMANEAGAITYWRLSGSVDLGELRQAWIGVGLPFKDLPAAPDPETALGRAVREVQRKRRLVRPLARRGAWVVKDEDVVGNDTVYTTVCHVRYVKGAIEPVEISRGDASVDYTAFAALRNAIRVSYHRHRAELQPEDISGWLVRLAGAQQATSLRDSGGVYFVPRSAMAFWRRATAVIETAQKSHRVFKIPALRNDEAIEAIMDSILAEAQKAAEVLEQELVAEGDDKLGQRALRGRAKKCEALLAKIGSYEDLLEVRMDSIKGRIEDLQSSVAAAALVDQERA